jgi:hypothetical protein
MAMLKVPDLPSPGAAALGKFDLNKGGASGITMTKRINKKPIIYETTITFINGWMYYDFTYRFRAN